MATSSSSGDTCKETITYFSDDDNNDDQGMTERSPVTKVVGDPMWMVPDNQADEEWNLGTAEEPKTIKVNKNLPDNFKAKARGVFEEFKDGFS